MVLFLVLGIVGALRRDDVGLLVLLGYLAQVVAGYISGRLAGGSGLLHGSLGALLLYLVTALFVVAAGANPGSISLVLSVAVAALVGSAGGALADARRRR